MSELRRCTKCGLFLPLLCFSGKSKSCRRCRKSKPFQIIYSPELSKIINGKKFCRVCSTWKPLDQFNKNKNAKDGHHSQCKKCSSKQNSKIHKHRYRNDPEYRERLLNTSTKWAKENRERSNEIARGWREKNPHEAKKVRIRHYWKNREERLSTSRNCYYQKHDEKLQYHRNYHRTHRRERCCYSRKYRQLYPEKVKIAKERWYKKNPDKINYYSASRRARERNAEGHFSINEWRFLKELFDYRCAYCGEKEYLTKDHLIPLIKGGRHDMSNIVPACVSCNSQKNASMDIEWLQKPLIRR